jgi:hypothetical protein
MAEIVIDRSFAITCPGQLISILRTSMDNLPVESNILLGRQPAPPRPPPHGRAASRRLSRSRVRAGPEIEAERGEVRGGGEVLVLMAGLTCRRLQLDVMRGRNSRPPVRPYARDDTLCARTRTRHCWSRVPAVEVLDPGQGRARYNRARGREEQGEIPRRPGGRGDHAAYPREPFGRKRTPRGVSATLLCSALPRAVTGVTPVPSQEYPSRPRNFPWN